MRAFIRLLVLSGAVVGLLVAVAYYSAPFRPPLADCGTGSDRPPVRDIMARRASQNVTGPTWSCVPPYETPTYSKAPDDQVALGPLLEAAGHSWAANTDWVGVASGQFCGALTKQLIVMTRQQTGFRVLGGPVPHAIGTGGAPVINSGGWRALAAGRLDQSAPYDELIAVRRITTSNMPDLPVARVGSAGDHCQDSAVEMFTTVGNPSNSDWVGVAVGNFDGTGPQIAMLKSQHSNLFLVKRGPTGLTVVHRGDLEGTMSSRWRALAAGDIDGDALDELIAVREVSDGHSPTVLAYKWNGSTFVRLAFSSFGNEGNSNWSGVAVGDFNSDGHNAIVVVKNRHSNFAVLDLPAGASELRKVTSADLDSTSGQPWTGVAATDWLGGDDRAHELIAIRAVHNPYRTNVFVYGAPFHRVMRETALEGTKAQWVQHLTTYDQKFFTPPTADLLKWLRDTHTNTFNWHLSSPGDYQRLVQFLAATRDWGVDGQQLRVWVVFVAPRNVPGVNSGVGDNCPQPEDTSNGSPQLTSWNAKVYFGLPLIPTNAQVIAACKNDLAWASVLGRLAHDFPHLVGFAIDDFSEQLPYPNLSAHPDNVFTSDYMAEMESRLRSQAPWMNFAPHLYYPLVKYSRDNWADFGLTLDSMIFFFRDEKVTGVHGRGPCGATTCPFVNDRAPGEGGCLDGVCADETVASAPGEFEDMRRLLAACRKLLVGVYYVPHGALGGPTIRYDYDLTRLGLNTSIASGVVAYGLQTPPWNCMNYPETGARCVPCTGPQCLLPTCTDLNFLDDAKPMYWYMRGTDRYCAIKKAYGPQP